MTLLGWLVMTICVGGSTGFLAWCIYLVLCEAHPSEHLHSPMEEPPDVQED